MSCNGESVMGVDEGLLLLPSNLLNDIFLDRIISQGDRGERRRCCADPKPRMHCVILNHHRSIETPTGDGASLRSNIRTFVLERSEEKPRGTGVFLPRRVVTTMSPSNKKRVEAGKKKQPCPVIYSHSKQIFLPKEWVY